MVVHMPIISLYTRQCTRCGERIISLAAFLDGVLDCLCTNMCLRVQCVCRHVLKPELGASRPVFRDVLKHVHEHKMPSTSAHV